MRNLSYKKEEKDDLFKWKTGRYSGGDFSCRTCKGTPILFGLYCGRIKWRNCAKQQYKDTILRSKDKLEIVSFVGGADKVEEREIWEALCSRHSTAVQENYGEHRLRWQDLGD